MSETHDKFKQVRLDPDTAKMAKNLQVKFTTKQSVAKLVNWAARLGFSKIKPS